MPAGNFECALKTLSRLLSLMSTDTNSGLCTDLNFDCRNKVKRNDRRTLNQGGGEYFKSKTRQVLLTSDIIFQSKAYIDLEYIYLII